MTLDYPSIVFFLSLNNIYIILLYIYQYIFHNKQWNILLFTLGIVFQTLTFIFFGVKDIYPFLYTVKSNNLILISSFAFTSFGLVSFDGRIRKKLSYIYLFCAIFFYTLILIVEQNMNMVHVVRISSCAFFYAITSYYLYNHKGKYKFAQLLCGVLTLFSIFQLFRAFNIYLQGYQELFQNNVINNFFFIISVFVISFCSIGYIMLLKEINQKIILRKNARIEQDKIKLEQLNLTQNKLFSVIAHDLRSPFINILGLSELIIENTDHQQNLESKNYIHLINSTAKNTLTLVDNLLNWSKNQSKKLELQPQKIILSKVILEIIELKSSLLDYKQITLNYEPINDIELYTDENILATILRNLISNAIKYTNSGGIINITTTADQHQVQISVSDNGVGMSKETIHKILNLTNNTSSPGTANEKGFGLGLILCREFIEKLQGSFWIESKENKGSIFKFTLPLHIAEQKTIQ